MQIGEVCRRNAEMVVGGKAWTKGVVCSVASGVRPTGGEGGRELGPCGSLLEPPWVMAFRTKVVLGHETSQASLTSVLP